MRQLAAILLAIIATFMVCGQEIKIDTTLLDTSYKKGCSPYSSLDDRKQFIKHIRDSIDAIPFDTTRDDHYWKRAIANGEWSFFTDITAKKPAFLNFAYKVYKFYTQAFNSYDTTYVVGIDKDWKLMLLNNNWVDAYGGKIADNQMRVFMHSNIYSSVGVHLSYLGIGYTYMFGLDHVFGNDPTKHSKWEISFETSKFSFEAYHSFNNGAVSINWFEGSKRIKHEKFDGIKRVSSGIDMYYFFNHRKYSQAAAYSFSKIQKRSAGSFITGFLIATQDVELNFDDLPSTNDLIPYNSDYYRYHYRSYSFMFGYAYNWVFRPNWLFNITMAPSVGWNHSYDDSIDGKRNSLALDIRGRLALVKIAGNFFFGLHLIFDGHLYHNKKHHFINSLEDLTLKAGFRF
ncbi:MAG: DUF4421 domain-containing protein [Muribaculaceae bacterium]|nr:DUF4421 domain-containing protein [Muribaculaceae bacterium]